MSRFFFAVFIAAGLVLAAYLWQQLGGSQKKVEAI
jgi:hypothetical protein